MSISKLSSFWGSLQPSHISNEKYNDYLKEAAKEAELNKLVPIKEFKNGLFVNKKTPKHKVISSHTARRTWCTNAYKDDIPTIAIMAISGHKTERSLLTYIRATPEEHAQKVLDIWKKNGEFINVAK